jgi:hypothetical protein
MAEADINTTATETAEQPAEQKVIFDEQQKARVSEIVKDAMSRAGREAREESERLRKELAAVTAKLPGQEPDALLERDSLRAELKALKDSQREASVRDALRAAAGDTFVDSDLACRLMRDRVVVADSGAVTVLAADGTPALDATLNPLSLGQLAQQIANERKYLARGVVLPGAGSTATRDHGTTAPKLADLFGPRSNGRLAQELMKRDSRAYFAMRDRAKKEGLL